MEYYVTPTFDKKGHACFTVRKRTWIRGFGKCPLEQVERVTDQTFPTREEAEAFISELYCGHLPEENYA